jgi:hypothetical protein
VFGKGNACITKERLRGATNVSGGESESVDPIVNLCVFSGKLSSGEQIIVLSTEIFGKLGNGKSISSLRSGLAGLRVLKVLTSNAFHEL